LEELEITEYAYNKALRSLLEQEIVQQDGNGRSTHYVLKENSEAIIFSNQRLIRDLEDMLRKKSRR